MTIEHRERVLRAATSSFLAHGYATSVDLIARRAGVAKMTVYHHFPSKDVLFKAVARDLAKTVLVELEGAPLDARRTLLRFARAYRRRALGAQGIAAFRTVVPEVPRFKAVARAMYLNTLGELAQQLADYLGKAESHNGLAFPDPRFSAEMFLSLLGGLDRIKRLFEVPVEGSEARRTAQIVELFLKAHTK